MYFYFFYIFDQYFILLYLKKLYFNSLELVPKTWLISLERKIGQAIYFTILFFLEK